MGIEGTQGCHIYGRNFSIIQILCQVIWFVKGFGEIFLRFFRGKKTGFLVLGDRALLIFLVFGDGKNCCFRRLFPKMTNDK